MTPRIVIADDDVELRAVLQQAVEQSGFSVDVAADGDELVALVTEVCRSGARLDLVITDVHMPRRSGLASLQEIRRMFPQVPVILMTAFGDPSMRERARHLGADSVFDKPLSLDDFLLAMFALLRREQAEPGCAPRQCAS